MSNIRGNCYYYYEAITTYLRLPGPTFPHSGISERAGAKGGTGPPFFDKLLEAECCLFYSPLFGDQERGSGMGF